MDPSAEAWLRDAMDLPFERVDADEALRRLLPRTKGLVVWGSRRFRDSRVVSVGVTCNIA